MPGERRHNGRRATTLSAVDDLDEHDVRRRIDEQLSSHEAAAIMLSSIQARLENETELRLDYKDLSAGRLVIVIHGLPTTEQEVPTLSADGAHIASATDSSPLVDETRAIREATGYAPALSMPLLLSAWRGREVLALDLIAATLEAAPAEDLGRATALTDYAKAVLYNGLGRYEDAAIAAQRACAQRDLDLFSWARSELVEAAARTGTRAAAADALRDLEVQTSAGTDRALGAWALSAALLSDSSAAETLYREAIDRFDRGNVAVQLARAQLVYGEWLRRKFRRVDAREQLRAANGTFTDIGAEAFAERARRELLATGETARKRTHDTRDVLTPQEAQIARLAQDGLSNPQIGAQLFISPRTVQYHLRKVFRKLEITSRNQLSRIPSSRLSTA